MLALGVILAALWALVPKRRRAPADGAPAAPSRFGELYDRWGSRYDVPPAFLRALAIRESSENPRAIGRNLSLDPNRWDYGLMQVNAPVGREIARRLGDPSFRLEDLFEPNLNVKYAAWLLNDNRARSGDRDLASMASAYNAGLSGGRTRRPFPNERYVSGVMGEYERLA